LVVLVFYFSFPLFFLYPPYLCHLSPSHLSPLPHFCEGVLPLPQRSSLSISPPITRTWYFCTSAV
jgi:hypothetical protein